MSDTVQNSSRFSVVGCSIIALLASPSLSVFVPPVYQVEVLPSGTTPKLAGLYQGHYDSVNDRILVAAQGNQKICSIKNGNRDFIATSAAFNAPSGVWSDTVGNIFMADRYAYRITKVSSAGQIILNFIGSGTDSATGDGGPATSATVSQPLYVAGDKDDNLFWAELGSGSRVRKLSKSGVVSTVAGGGAATANGAPATSSALGGAMGVYVNSNGDVFVSMWGGNRVQMISKATKALTTVIGGGSINPTTTMTPSLSVALVRPWGIWVDARDNLYVAEERDGDVVLLTAQSNYAESYKVASIIDGVSVFGDNNSGKLYAVVGNYGSTDGFVKVLTDPLFVPGSNPTAGPSVAPSTQASAAPSASPSIAPSASPSVVPTATPSSAPSVTPSSTPSEAPTLAVPEYSLTVSAKSFKYFEVRVFTEANERVFPMSYELVDCPENAGAVIWGHESTPITEDTNTCVYGLSRHYWCECPALVNGNKPKLTLNFGGTVFDRVELLILDWVDGEVVVSDSANNIVLFSASRAGGPLAGEEFVGYDHLNLLQVAPSVVPTVAPSSVPTTKPSWTPTTKPTVPSVVPTQTPTVAPTTTKPSAEPSVTPSMVPSAAPSFTAQYTITLTAKTFKYFEVRVYTHDNLRIFPVSYELEHCPENAGVTVWNDQTTEDTNTCVYGYPRNFWCQCAAEADEKPKLVLHMGHTVFDRVELLLLNWEDGEVTVTDEANHETFLSATHDGVGNEFVTFGNLNLEHAEAAPVRRLLRGG